MTAVDRDLVDMMSAVFASHREKTSGADTETRSAAWDLELWEQLSEVGLARLTGSEDTGGSGADWFASAELLSAAATHGVSAPIVEHDLLAGWLLETAGLPIDNRRRTACILDQHGVARDVGWAASAERVVVIWRSGDTSLLADVPAADLTIRPGTNVAGEPRDTVTTDIAALTGTHLDESIAGQFVLRGALARAVQICAALERTLELTVVHATERHQFGRPLARFQAVTNLIADIAAETSLARAATEAALASAVRGDWTGENLEFAVAVARSCVGQATSVAVRNAHQVHGAIGTTREHRLHEFTLAALAWRSEFGSTHHWDEIVASAALDVGADGLWALITG